MYYFSTSLPPKLLECIIPWIWIPAGFLGLTEVFDLNAPDANCKPSNVQFTQESRLLNNKSLFFQSAKIQEVDTEWPAVA